MVLLRSALLDPERAISETFPKERLAVTYPNIEIKILICHGFDIEAYRRYCGDDLSYLDTHPSVSSELRFGYSCHTLSLYSKVVFPALS